MDEFTRECLAIDVAMRLTSEDVLERLSDLFVHRAVLLEGKTLSSILASFIEEGHVLECAPTRFESYGTRKYRATIPFS